MDKEVVFLGKEYTIPTDVVTYVGLVDFTNDIRENLVSSFKRKIFPNIEAIESDSFMIPEINEQVSKFIRRLLENDIYNKTANDYLKNNKGLDLFLDTKKKVIRQIISIRTEKNETYRSGVQAAIYKKEASVTGLDFGIISNSFVNHMIYAYMDASEQTKQEKEALKVYNREIAELDRAAEAYDRQEIAYISDNVIPAMTTVFTCFAYELLDRYISDLIAADRFDRAALDFIDLERSNDLLENLNYAGNKKAVIESAFVACPFNIAVYMQAMKHDLLDYDTFQTCKIFKQSDTILAFLKDSWGEVSFPLKFDINYYCVNMLASFTDRPPEAFLRVHTEQYATGIVKAYARVAEMIADKARCRKVIGECAENSILEGNNICHHKACSYVNPIVTDSIWSQLTEQCGHKDLLKRIKKYIPQDITVNSKENADAYFTEQLCAAFEDSRKELAEEIIRERKEEEERRKEELRKKEEEKRIREEKRQQQVETNRKAFKVLLKVVAGVVVVVIVYFAIMFINDTVISPAKQYKSAVALMEAGEYKAAREIFVFLDGYKDSNAMIVQCNDAECEATYNAALQMMDEKEYSRAIVELRKLGGYKNSQELIEQCQNTLRNDAYVQAVQLMNDGKYEEAIEAFKKLSGYNDSKEKIAECEAKIIDNLYIHAVSLANNGSYEEAIDVLEELGNYRDAEDIIEKCQLLGCEVGDEIVFGSYEQDGNLSNGSEAIEWIVLERDGNKALLISKYCLEQMPFNETLASVTWEDCSVRKWLNGEFRRTAFTGAEASQVVNTRIVYPDDVDQEYIQDYTYDKVFLLSENEVLKYFDSDWDRSTDATEYVSTDHCYWILRTHGSVSNVAHVDYKGYVGYYEDVDREWWIRPAMWIEIKESLFDVGEGDLESIKVAVDARNIKYASSFVGRTVDADGNIDVSDEEYDFLMSSVTLFGLQGRFYLDASAEQEDNRKVDIVQWQSNSDVSDFENFLDKVEAMYGCDNVVTNELGVDAFTWKNIDDYSCVYCWLRSDGKVAIRWTR